MLKKFLNKKMSPFLDQPFPENILPHLRIRNKTKKLLNKRKTARAHPKLQGAAFKGKKHGMKKIEGQVVKQFSNKNFTLPENFASTPSNILSELSTPATQKKVCSFFAR